MVKQIDRKVEEILRSPIGCEFLLSVEASGLSPVEVGIPRNSLWLAAGAVEKLDWWRTDHAETVADALEHGERLRVVARAVLEHPATAWWLRTLGPRTPSLDFPRQGPPGHGQLAASQLPSRPLGTIRPKTPYRTIPMHLHLERRRHVPSCGGGLRRGRL